MFSQTKNGAQNEGHKPQQFLVHVEMLRGFSVGLVLLYHFGVPGFSFGYLGVDIFFVISGFLMATIYGELGSKAAIQDFFIRRAGRLLPAYFVTITACAAVSAFFLLPHEVEQVAEQNLWSAALLPNFGFWQDASYFNYMYFRPLLNLWSLGVELQFYLIFPLLLLVARNSSRGLALIFVTSLLIAGTTNLVDPSSAFFLLPARLWEFLLGYYAATYKIQVESDIKKSPWALSSLVQQPKFWLALILCALVFLLEFVAPIYFYQSQLDIGASRIVVVHFLIAGGCAAAILRWGEDLARKLKWSVQALRLLGQYSYSIYLVHFPIIAFSNYQPFAGTRLGFQDLSAYIIALLLTVLATVGLYHLVEVPTRKLFSGKQLLGGSIAMMVIAAISIQPLVLLSRANLDGPTLLISGALYDRGPHQCEAAPYPQDLLEASCELLSREREDQLQTRYLLAGNSHADMIKPILTDLLNDGNSSLRYMKEYRAIDSRFDGSAVLEEAKKHSVDVIILHATRQDDNGQALFRFVQNAAIESIKVTYISPIPVYASAIPNTMLQAWREKDEVLIEGVDRASHMELLAEHYQVLRKIQSQVESFQWLDPTDIFCSTVCAIATPDGKPYYYDSNHLTLTGASLMAPLLLEIEKD